MRSSLRTAFAVCVGGVVLGACTDQSSAPTAVKPRAVIPSSVSRIQLTETCDVNQIKADARAYAKKSNDVLLSTHIAGLATAVKNSNIVSATDKVFDALSRIGLIRGTADQKNDITPEAFHRLVTGLLKCADDDITANVPELPAGGFGLALGRNWAFDVRGKTAAPADETGPVYERGATDGNWWVLDKNAASWPLAITSNWSTDRVLIFGFRTDFLNISGRVGGSSFDHRTIPETVKPVGTNPFFTLSALVGLCFGDNAPINSTQRVNHNGQFLALTPYVCGDPPQFTPATGFAVGRFGPRSLAQLAASFFTPRPLHAATIFVGGSVTGSPDDFSPSAVYDLSGLQLAAPGEIADGQVSVPLFLKGTNGAPITLPVTITANGAPAPDGTPVTVSIVGNSSNIAFFKDNAQAAESATVTRYVENGSVSYAGLLLTKAGGYQLGFQITLPPPAVTVGPVVTSPNSFQMQNK